MAERRRSQGWGQIQQRWFPTKSPNACRKRHERLMSRKAADEWEGEKFEMLAHTYWTFRRQMWDSVANQIGAPWEVVEQTVRMSRHELGPVVHRHADAVNISAWKRA